MQFTRARDLTTVGLAAGVLVYLVFQLAYGDLPNLPTFAGFTLLVIAVVEALLGFSLRGKIRRMAEGLPIEGRPLQPLTAARAVALAKASSLLGAIMLGAWLAILVFLLPRRAAVDAAAEDMPSAIVGAICAAVLIGAALWLEFCCRTPPDQDERGAEPAP